MGISQRKLRQTLAEEMLFGKLREGGKAKVDRPEDGDELSFEFSGS